MVEQKLNSLDLTRTRMHAGLVPARYVLIPVFGALTGYTEKAVRRKIEEGTWLEGHEYKRAPDGHIVVDLEGYCKWVEGQRPAA